MRGRQNFAEVTDVIPRLADAGVRVRIATTVESPTASNGTSTTGATPCTGRGASPTTTTSSAR